MMPLVGFPGYFATEDGHIYSSKSHRVLAERESRLGYKRVNLFRDGKHCDREVHRLVLAAYVGEKPGVPVLHGPAGKHDNRPENLYYGSQYQNMQDKKRDGTHPTGSKNPFAKLDEVKVAEIKAELRIGVSQRKLADRFGVSSGTISNINVGRYWSHVE